MYENVFIYGYISQDINFHSPLLEIKGCKRRLEDKFGDKRAICAQLPEQNLLANRKMARKQMTGISFSRYGKFHVAVRIQSSCKV